MQLFCMSCNKGTQYMGSKPAFCSHCGKSYISAAVNNNTAAAIAKPTFTPQFNIVNQPSINNTRVQTSSDDESGDIQSFDAAKIGKTINCEITVTSLRPNRQTSEQVFVEGMRGVDRDFTPRIKPAVKREKVTKAEMQQRKQDIMSQFKNDFNKNSSSKTSRNSVEIE